MGWMCSWVAVEGADKNELLKALDLVDTGEEVLPGERNRDSPFSYMERDNGWIVVFGNGFEWADTARVVSLSRLGLTVGCQFEDKVEMTSVVCAAKDGVVLWRVYHDNGLKGDKLEVSGNPPDEFSAIREEMLRQQANRTASVDYIHEVPVELAKAVCGYRTDEEPDAFHGLRPAQTQSGSGSGSQRGRGFWARLFGGSNNT
jgi:hypothetical protein